MKQRYDCYPGFGAVMKTQCWHEQSAHWVSIAKSIRTTLRLKNSKHFRM